MREKDENVRRRRRMYEWLSFKMKNAKEMM
jgi:hypothetical protein